MTSIRSFFPLVLASITLSLLPACASTNAPAFAAPLRPEARAVTFTNIEYGQAAGEKLLLDISEPAGVGPFPIAILVHGGGWTGGDKASADNAPLFGLLTDARFTWFSINYRLAPQHRWPACLDDVQTAIRWVKAHASEFKGDPRAHRTRRPLGGRTSGVLRGDPR